MTCAWNRVLHSSRSMTGTISMFEAIHDFISVLKAERTVFSLMALGRAVNRRVALCTNPPLEIVRLDFRGLIFP